MNIRNVPQFFTDHGRPDLAYGVKKHLASQGVNSREDKFDTEILMGHLVEEPLNAPTPEDWLNSPDFAYLKSLAFQIREMEEDPPDEIVIDLDIEDMVL